MENQNRLRLLYIYQYLLEHTDEDHKKSTVELIRMLSDQYDMKASYTTIREDMKTLRRPEFHIEFKESTQNQYYYDKRPFEVSELKILIDALISAKFITEGRSRGLITKLLSLTTAENASSISRHISVKGAVKSDSRSGYYSVDPINEAINSGRKISFRYTDFDVKKQRYITNDGNFYTLCPYDLTWDGDFYYVRGYCDERQSMRTFRLDRMEAQPVLLDEAAVNPPADYDATRYNKTVFRMYDTEEPEDVELLCDVSVMKYLIDNFGNDFDSTIIDDKTFKAKVTVCTSTTFYRWIFGFGDKIHITGPDHVVDAYKKMLQNAIKKYE